MPADVALPQVLLFLNVIYPGMPGSGWRMRTSATSVLRRFKIRQVQSDLRSLNPKKLPFQVLRELEPITHDDVMEWFGLHNIYDSEERRMKRAQEIFQQPGMTSSRRSMAEIEAVLGTIHREFVAERGYV
jgi:hypothetical protein